jgi:hypothetical protein
VGETIHESTAAEMTARDQREGSPPSSFVVDGFRLSPSLTGLKKSSTSTLIIIRETEHVHGMQG